MEANVVVAACRLVLDLLSSVQPVVAAQQARAYQVPAKQAGSRNASELPIRDALITILCFFLSELLTPLALRQ